jgi:hypothetical protein
MLPAGSMEVEELRFQVTGYRHCKGCITPQTVTHSLVLLKMGGINARNIELIGIINKPLLLHPVGVCIIYINWARSNKYQSINTSGYLFIYLIVIQNTCLKNFLILLNGIPHDAREGCNM